MDCLSSDFFNLVHSLIQNIQHSKNWFSLSILVRRYIDELEELLDDTMIEQFSMQTEDDSIQEVRNSCRV